MMKKLPILLTFWLFFSFLFAQEDTLPVTRTPVNQATLIGIGRSSVLDTYLSPFPYSGQSFSLLHDRLHSTRFFQERMLFQHHFHFQYANTTNPAGNVIAYYLNFSYHLTGFVPVIEAPSFRLFVGGGADASLGGIWNMRNSNNPGSAKASTNLNVAVMARYSLYFPFWNWRMLDWGYNRVTLRWQLSSPFAGMFFSPGFGQSYYEIFVLGNRSGIVHFGSFHNQQALRNYFTVDIPLRRVTLRTGYLGTFYRTDVNHLITNIASHQFVIGLAFETLSLGGRRRGNVVKGDSVF